MRDYTKEERDAACTNADYHIQEIVEGLIPEVENLTQAMRDDIRQRLISSFYEGLEFTKGS